MNCIRCLMSVKYFFALNYLIFWIRLAEKHKEKQQRQLQSVARFTINTFLFLTNISIVLLNLVCTMFHININLIYTLDYLTFAHDIQSFYIYIYSAYIYIYIYIYIKFDIYLCLYVYICVCEVCLHFES